MKTSWAMSMGAFACCAIACGGALDSSGADPGAGDGNTGTPTGERSGALKRVFVTSDTFASNFGGPANADGMCQSSAEKQNLGGSWKAWISSGSINAIDRIADVGPWYLVDKQTKVFDNKASLTLFPLQRINEDETGDLPPWFHGDNVSAMWTGTNEHGLAVSGGDCSQWTTTSADATASCGSISNTPSWGGADQGTSVPCSESKALFCFEQ